MTATSVMRNPGSVLLVWCLCLAAVFLAACGGAQPTAGTEVQTDPQATAITTVQPTAGTEAQTDPQPTEITTVQPNAGSEMHAEVNPEWFVAPSLDEQIFDALDSNSMVVVRATLSSLTSKAETISGTPTTYRPIHELRFTVHEYLEGSGPNEVVVVVRGNTIYTDEATAIEHAQYAAGERNNSWDNRQAVLFVDLSQTTSGASGATGRSFARTAEFIRSNPQESPWDYTVDNLSRAWLPAQAAAGKTADSTRSAADSTFITDGAETPSPTITLADLKAKIAAMEAELTAGEGTAGFRDCVRDRILRERVYRAEPGGPRQRGQSLGSGRAAGAEIYSRDNNHREPKYNNYWLSGPDANLFQALNADDDSSSATGYTYMLSTVRPLPAGEYSVHYIFQHHDYLPCNFKPDDTYSDWTVTVTAPAGTVHEAFFDPVAIGSGVGADASNGALEPKAFSMGGVSTALQSLKWETGSATLTLRAPASLSGHFLDFIALDGTTALSLDGGAAAVSGGTLTWNVASQPWQVGDKLMLRIRQASSTPTDATLSALALSGVTLSPAFASATTAYTANGANGVGQTTVSPTVNDGGANYVIKLGGVTDADGTVDLAVGSNVITVEVTAEDGTTTKTYTVTVTRAAPSTDATLSALGLSGVTLSPAFASPTTAYTADVANDVEQTTVTATVNDDGASSVVKIGGVTDADGTVDLAVGANVITVEVTAEDGTTTKTYTVTVTRAATSTDATLSALGLSGVTLSPAFASATTAYTADVANDVEQTTVTPTTNYGGASYVVKLGGVGDADGTMDLAVGANVITVEVTAEDGTTTETYTATVTRAASVPTPTPAPVDSGNPSVSEVTGTSLRVSWDRVRPSGTFLQDLRVNYRLVGATDWSFGAYVDTSTWSSRRQAATVSGLTCGTNYEFQIEAQYSNRWHHYGRIDAATSGC